MVEYFSSTFKWIVPRTSGPKIWSCEREVSKMGKKAYLVKAKVGEIIMNLHTLISHKDDVSRTRARIIFRFFFLFLSNLPLAKILTWALTPASFEKQS